MSVTNEPPLRGAKRQRSQTTLARGAAVLAIALALGATVWLERDLLLREVASLWIVSDPVGAADVAVVLGGGVEDRPFAAAAYYREGLVRKILVSNAHQGPAEKLGAVSASASADEAVLLKLGVPASAIESFGDDLKNTNDEALALRDWAQHSGARSVIVPTEIFSARRVRWTLHRAFGDDVLIRVPALDPPDYRRNNWWQHSEGLIGFQNEVIKYIYYRIKY